MARPVLASDRSRRRAVATTMFNINAMMTVTRRVGSGRAGAAVKVTDAPPLRRTDSSATVCALQSIMPSKGTKTLADEAAVVACLLLMMRGRLLLLRFRGFHAVLFPRHPIAGSAMPSRATMDARRSARRAARPQHPLAPPQKTLSRSTQRLCLLGGLTWSRLALVPRTSTLHP